MLSSVQFSHSVVCNSLQPHESQHASLPVTNSQSLLKLTSIEFVMPSNHLILCRPLLLLPSILPSISVFPNESSLLIRWPKYWSFSFSISLSLDISLHTYIMRCIYVYNEHVYVYMHICIHINHLSIICFIKQSTNRMQKYAKLIISSPFILISLFYLAAVISPIWGY